MAFVQKVKFKKSRWWTLPFKKIVKCNISANVSLILINFGTTITSTLILGHCLHKGMETQKDSMSFYFLPQNNAKKVQISVCMPNA